MAALLESHTHTLLVYQPTITMPCCVTNYHKTQLKIIIIYSCSFICCCIGRGCQPWVGAISASQVSHPLDQDLAGACSSQGTAKQQEGCSTKECRSFEVGIKVCQVTACLLTSYWPNSSLMEWGRISHPWWEREGNEYSLTNNPTSQSGQANCCSKQSPEWFNSIKEYFLFTQQHYTSMFLVMQISSRL